MQNWNQWQLPAGAVTTPVPQPPVGYAAAAGADPMTLMQSYMQYYNQPAPSGYTPEQWASTQQQGWAQWQQWQQQYQQWQAQYGDKYQETMKQLSAQSMNLAVSQTQLPPPPHVQPPPPPLPKEDATRPPPLPPTTAAANTYHQFASMPPPHQNNLPLFPAKESVKEPATKTTVPQANAANYPTLNHQQPPPLPGTSQQQLPPLPPEIENKRENVGQGEKRDSTVIAIDGESDSAKKLKREEDDEEMTEAEKTFDAQFKQWEEQFNKWKQQNVNHPDKTQYKQYEAKWTSWREKLLERREQMRKKREQQKQVAAAKVTTTESDKSGKNNISGDEKILNILSNTDNQRLINNLLGIGKTLGLTGKQQNATATTPLPPPPPPPPPPETVNSDNQSSATQKMQQNIADSNVVQPTWSSQQWGSNQQYNPRMEISSYGMPSSVMHYHPTTSFGHQITSPNFAQPPPSLPLSANNNNASPNFSQPPPNFSISNNNSNNNVNQERSTGLQNTMRSPASAQDRPPSIDIRFAHHANDRDNFDSGQQSNFLRRGGSDQDHHFGRREDSGVSNPKGNEQDQFTRPTGRQNDFFNDRIEVQQRFRRGDRSYGGDFGNSPLNAPNNFTSNNDGRFGSANERPGLPINERFTGGNNRFGPIGNDRFASLNDRFTPNHDRYGSERFGSGERFIGSETDRFSRSGPGNENRFDRPDNERFGPNDHFERFGTFADRPGLADDRFDLKNRSFPPTVNDRYGPNANEYFESGDRFGRNNAVDCFDPKDTNDHRRGDTFSSNSRGFNRNPLFNLPNELSPELRKLMEKRKGASDVFRPSFISDSEKLSSVGSLSESFKKIAGDSPFRNSFDFSRNRAGSSSSSSSSSANIFSSAASGGLPPTNFQTNSFTSDSASLSYGHHPRSQSFNNAHANSNEPPVLSLSAFRPSENFAKHDNIADYNERMDKDTESRPQNSTQQSQSINVQSQSPTKHLDNIETSINPDSSSLQTDNIQDTKNIQVTKQTNEIDTITIEQKDDTAINCESNLPKKEDNNGEKSEISVDNGSEPLQQQQCDDKKQDNNGEKKEERNNNDNNDDSIAKKPESLPFMGENDPRPEDLNIEPPPELPNLGPIPINTETPEPFNETFDIRRPVGNRFNARFESSVLSGPRGMEFKAGAPFGPRGPPPMFGPRASHPFPMSSSSFQLQGHDKAQVGPPLGPNDAMQFRPNAELGDSGRFSPRRLNEHDDRDRNDKPLSSETFRGLNVGPFGPMDGQLGQFGGPRGPGSGKFDIQIRPGGPTDSPFAPRNAGPFEFRNNDVQFGPRDRNDRLDSRAFCSKGTIEDSYVRGPSETLLGTRRPGDSAQFGALEPNNGRFGKANETSFDKLPPTSFDNNGPSFGFLGGLRKPNEGLPLISPRGPNDAFGGSRGPPPDNIFSQGRRSPKTFNENRFDSQNINDNLFDFKNKSLTAKDPMGDLNGPNYVRDYVRRGGTFTRRGQFEGDARQFDSPMIRPNDRFDRNIDVEMCKDNSNEYARRMPADISYKKELGDNLGSRSPSYGSANDVWRNKFNDDKRNIDRNPISGNANQFDERSRLQRTVGCEPRIMGDLRPGYDEVEKDADRSSKFHGSNLFVKRSQSTRSSGGGHHGEFCASRQFNYNHGETVSGDSSSNDKKFIAVEYTPAKVIDYGHTSRPAVVDHHLSSPVQCFDYAHGDLKSVVPMDQQSKKDFSWVEGEKSTSGYVEKTMTNLKEYGNKKTRNSYDNYERSSYDARKSVSSDYGKQRMKEHVDWQQRTGDMRLSGEREKRENEERKERSSTYDPHEERFFERNLTNDHQSGDRCHQSDRNIHRERPQETSESSRRETNKDSDKDGNRSKGNVNWQENSNKNVIDSKLQDTSLSDTKKNVESTSKTLELAKTPNYTMVDDLLCPPGRQNRPPKIAIILRGPPGSGKSFVAKLIKDKEVEQGGSAPRILSLDDYFLVEKEIETKDDNGKKIVVKEMAYEYEEAMEQSYITSLVKAFKKNITDGFFNFIILDCINEKISDYEEMWSFAKTKGFKVYVCEMEMDLQICLKRNIHNRTEDEINRIIDYFEPTSNYHQKLDVNSMLQEQAIEEVDMEDSQETQEKSIAQNEDSQDSQDVQDAIGVSKWEKMEAEDKLDRLDGLAKKKSETKPQTIEDFLQVPDYYNMEDTPGKKRVRWADLEERKEQEKMRAVGFVVGHTNWDRMMDPTKGGSALTRTKYI